MAVELHKGKEELKNWNPELPIPRLELVYIPHIEHKFYVSRWEYSLVVMRDKIFTSIPIEATESSSHYSIGDYPIRMGYNAKEDMKSLNLPTFLVYPDKVIKIKL